jgi:hypothetical protein
MEKGHHYSGIFTSRDCRRFEAQAMKLWTSLRIACNEEDAVRTACPKGKKWLRIIKETPFFMNIPESERMSSQGKGACRRDMALIHCHVETVLI